MNTPESPATLDTDTPTAPEAETELPLPEDFNLDDWFQGVRATVHAANITQRGDLVAEIEEAERALQLVQADDADEYGIEDAGTNSAESLNARLDDLYRQYLESCVTFKVEGRSAEWLTAVEKEVNGSVETRGLPKDQKTAWVTRHQLARSIIAPKGVTVAHLAQLEEVSGAQYRKLVGAFFAACSQAPVVTAPTSPSSSASRGGRGR